MPACWVLGLAFYSVTLCMTASTKTSCGSGSEATRGIQVLLWDFQVLELCLRLLICEMIAWYPCNSISTWPKIKDSTSLRSFCRRKNASRMLLSLRGKVQKRAQSKGEACVLRICQDVPASRLLPYHCCAVRPETAKGIA